MNKEYDGFSDTTRDSADSGYLADPTNEVSNPQPKHLDSEPKPAHNTVRVDAPEAKGASRTNLVWAALILGALILVMLLIFIVQNNVSTNFDYLSWSFSLPLGVAMLIAAIAGALVMAMVGSVRIMQLSLEVRKLRKQQERIARELA